MELKTHWQIIKKYHWLIIGVAVLLMIAGFLIGLLQPAKYEATTSFSIIAKTDNNNLEQSYYLLKSSELLGDTLMSWTITPRVVADIFSRAQVNPEQYGINIENYFHAKRYSPQNVIIKFIVQDKDLAQKLADNLIQIFSDKSAREWRDFYPQSFEPTIIVQQSSPWLYSAIGLIAGLVLGIIFAHLSWYFKEN